MAQDGITIKVTEKQVTAALERLATNLDDLSPAMREIANALLDHTEEAFRNEGPGWPALAPGTVKRRGSANPILQVTGALARSITPESGPTFAAIATVVPYAAIHQFGGQIRQGAQSRATRFAAGEDGQLAKPNLRGRGLKFARRDEPAIARFVARPEYTIDMPARPFLPIEDRGGALSLIPPAEAGVLAIINAHLVGDF